MDQEENCVLFEHAIFLWSNSVVYTPHRPYTFNEFWMAKMNYTLSFMALIDLLSFLPNYIELIVSAVRLPCIECFC